MPTKNNSSPVFDVAKPGKSMPSPTSRPLITSRGPIMKDPTVKEVTEEEARPKVTTAVKRVVAPISDGKDEPSKPEAEEKSATPVQLTDDDGSKPKDSEASKADKPEPAEDDSKETAQPEESETEKAETDQPAEPQNPNEPSKEELERMAAIEKHIEDKTYFVTVGQVTRRRTARRVLLTLIALALILTVAGYFVLSEELIDINDISLPW